MFHRFFFGRFVLLLLVVGGVMAAGRGLYRSGFEDGFVRGMAFAAEDGGAAEAAPLPPAYGEWGRGYYGVGPVERGVMGAGIILPILIGLSILAILRGFGHRHRGHHPAWGHGHGSWDQGSHGHGWGHRPDEPGPEKQPEEYL